MQTFNQCVTTKDIKRLVEIQDLIFSSFYPVAFAQIDWHDFVVVETVNFREEESGIYSSILLNLMPSSISGALPTFYQT